MLSVAAEDAAAHPLRHDLWLRLPQRYCVSRGVIPEVAGSVTQGSDQGGCGGGPSAGEGARGLQPAPAAALVAGTAAMRNTKRGSWYVEALTQVFSERACDMHVADMLVKVSGLRPAAQCSTLLLPCTGFQSSTTLPLVLGF